ncbi:unnamed protein product [Parnassius apollo]|uniref:(apollo) hypothetical protein n=1 Tax=Parnassius apollo TaxID=110799 RepID=A0A8S3Y8T3_PARAO|nr:unnamed protein product [Parnassius apollo]
MGGGGTVLSVGAARELSSCACATRAAPDDMALGACARRRSVTLAHSHSSTRCDHKTTRGKCWRGTGRFLSTGTRPPSRCGCTLLGFNTKIWR